MLAMGAREALKATNTRTQTRSQSLAPGNAERINHNLSPLSGDHEAWCVVPTSGIRDVCSNRILLFYAFLRARGGCKDILEHWNSRCVAWRGAKPFIPSRRVLVTVTERSWKQHAIPSFPKKSSILSPICSLLRKDLHDTRPRMSR